MSRSILLLLLAVASVSAVGTCYITYCNNPNEYSEISVFSFKLENGTDPSEPWVIGAGTHTNFINQTHVALRVGNIFRREGQASLYNVYTNETTATFDLSVPLDSESDDILAQLLAEEPASSYASHSGIMNDLGVFMVATNNGGVYWLNLLPAHSNDSDAGRPFLSSCGFWGGRAMTWNPTTRKPEAIGDLCFHMANLTYVLISNSDTFRLYAESSLDWQSLGLAVTYDSDNNVAYNITVRGFMPSVFGTGYARAFVMNQTSGRTHFPTEAEGSYIKEAATLNQDVKLENVYNTGNIQWYDVCNDGAQYYFLTASDEGSKFYIHTLSNDFTATNVYGPFKLPINQNFIDLGALSCSMAA